MLLAGLLLLADLAVPAKGPPLQGEITLNEAAASITLGERQYRLADLLLVEKEDGRLVWTASFRARLDAYGRIFHWRRRKTVVALLKEAYRTRDPGLCRMLHDAAKVGGGWSGKEEETYRKRIEKLEKKPPKVIKAKKAAEIRKRYNATWDEYPAMLLKRAAAEPATGGARLRLLSEALNTAPKHAASLPRLREWVPKAAPFERTKDRLWWHAELEPLGFELVEDAVELKRQRHRWRPDLYAMRSGDLLVLTPIKRLDALRTALKHAQLSIRFLKRMFRTDKPVARNPAPLLVLIYGNKQNFVEQRRYQKSATVPPYFRFDQGHFDLRDNVSRFLGADGVHAQYLHWVVKYEIVRHWLWTKNPRYSSKQVLDAFSNPGYWVVPGLAEMIAESPSNPDSETGLDVAGKDLPSIKLLAGSKPLPWREFLMMDRDDVANMEGKRAGRFAAGYYGAQAACLCRYLYNKPGGRQQLVDYMTNYYTSKTAGLNPKTALGMGGEDLGTAVVAYIRSK